MAEHGTRKTTIDRLEDASSRLTVHHESLASKHSDLASKVDTLHNQAFKVGTLLNRLNHLHTMPTVPPTSPHPSRPHVKLDAMRFNSNDPLGWIFKISQFFDYQGMPEEECITVTSLYKDGPALSRFQWSNWNNFITSWPGFLQALESHFAPTYYDDPKGVLFKLSQRGFVNQYPCRKP